MPWFDFYWGDQPGDNLEHIAEHGLTREDVNYVVQNPTENIRSRSSNRLAVKGYTPDGRFLFVTYEMIDDVTVYVVTAYEVSE